MDLLGLLITRKPSIQYRLWVYAR